MPCIDVKPAKCPLRDLGLRTGQGSPYGCRQLRTGVQRARRMLRLSRRDIRVPAIRAHRRSILVIAEDGSRPSRCRPGYRFSRPCVGRVRVLRTREKTSGSAVKRLRTLLQRPYVLLAYLASEFGPTAAGRYVSPRATPSRLVHDPGAEPLIRPAMHSTVASQ